MNKQRLTVLTNHLIALDALPKLEQSREFNMGVYYVEKPCGTMCCALGEAGLLKEFNDEGFFLQHYPSRATVHKIPSYHFGARREVATGICAAEKFFDISNALAHHLFSSERYKKDATRTQVAQRIMQFVENEQTKITTVSATA